MVKHGREFCLTCYRDMSSNVSSTENTSYQHIKRLQLTEVVIDSLPSKNIVDIKMIVADYGFISSSEADYILPRNIPV